MTFWSRPVPSGVCGGDSCHISLVLAPDDLMQAPRTRPLNWMREMSWAACCSLVRLSPFSGEFMNCTSRD